MSTTAGDFRELEGFAYPQDDLRSLASLDSHSGDDDDGTSDLLSNNTRMVMSAFAPKSISRSMGSPVGGFATLVEDCDATDAVEQIAADDVPARVDKLIVAAERRATAVFQHEATRVKMVHATTSFRRIADFGVALPYQLESFFLADRRAGAVGGNDPVVTACRPDVPLGDRPAVLLFSLPSGTVPALERRALAFVRSFTTAFTVVDQTEVRSMRRAANTVVHSLPETELFGAHLESRSGTITFGVLAPPPLGYLRARIRSWVLESLRQAYVDRVEELFEEATTALVSGIMSSGTPRADSDAEPPSAASLT
jgi:hypothetical protein